jgi:ankyrin repeat protein
MHVPAFVRFGVVAAFAAAVSGVVFAAPTAPARRDEPQGRTEPRRSPVADAAQAGDLATVRRLLKEGTDVNAALGDGTTALHHAAMRGEA